MEAAVRIRIQEADFDLAAEHAWLAASGPGAVVTFTGLVREFDRDLEGRVEGLFLQHYPGMTERLLGEVVEEACRRWPLCAVVVIHRVGRLAPGERIVLVGVAAHHRAPAFAAAAFLMDYLKTRATFWKRTDTDRGSRWLGLHDEDRRAAARWEEPW